MALFALLLVLLIERMRFSSESLQFEAIFARYQAILFDDEQLKNGFYMLLAMSLPAITVALLATYLTGVWFGVFHLALWIMVGVVLLSHHTLREQFRAYLRAAHQGDAQSCYHQAQQLDIERKIEVQNESELGVCMGQLSAWINYRFYGVVALYFVLLGPAAAVFYATVRGYHDYFCKQELNRPFIKSMMFVLDWLPARIIALGFALSGHFSRAMAVWLPLALDYQVSPRDLICEVALAAEDTSTTHDDPICVQSTLALLKLSKRNLALLLVMVATLTIFGVIH